MRSDFSTDFSTELAAAAASPHDYEFFETAVIHFLNARGDVCLSDRNADDGTPLVIGGKTHLAIVKEGGFGEIAFVEKQDEKSMNVAQVTIQFANLPITSAAPALYNERLSDLLRLHSQAVEVDVFYNFKRKSDGAIFQAIAMSGVMQDAPKYGPALGSITVRSLHEKYLTKPLLRTIDEKFTHAPSASAGKVIAKALGLAVGVPLVDAGTYPDLRFVSGSGVGRHYLVDSPVTNPVVAMPKVYWGGEEIDSVGFSGSANTAQNRIDLEIAQAQKQPQKSSQSTLTNQNPNSEEGIALNFVGFQGGGGGVYSVFSNKVIYQKFRVASGLKNPVISRMRFQLWIDGNAQSQIFGGPQMLGSLGVELFPGSADHATLQDPSSIPLARGSLNPLDVPDASFGIFGSGDRMVHVSMPLLPVNDGDELWVRLTMPSSISGGYPLNQQEFLTQQANLFYYNSGTNPYYNIQSLNDAPDWVLDGPYSFSPQYMNGTPGGQEYNTTQPGAPGYEKRGLGFAIDYRGDGDKTSTTSSTTKSGSKGTASGDFGSLYHKDKGFVCRKVKATLWVQELVKGSMTITASSVNGKGSVSATITAEDVAVTDPQQLAQGVFKQVEIDVPLTFFSAGAISVVANGQLDPVTGEFQGYNLQGFETVNDVGGTRDPVKVTASSANIDFIDSNGLVYVKGPADTPPAVRMGIDLVALSFGVELLALDQSGHPVAQVIFGEGSDQIGDGVSIAADCTMAKSLPTECVAAILNQAGVLDSRIDLAGSFADTASKLGATYHHDGAFISQTTYKEAILKLCYETRCGFDWLADKARMVYIPGPEDPGLAAAETITDEEIAASPPADSKTPVEVVEVESSDPTAVVNTIDFDYYLNLLSTQQIQPSRLVVQGPIRDLFVELRPDDKYQKRLTFKDPVSRLIYGELRRDDLSKYDFIRRDAMALAVGRFRLFWQSEPRDVVTATTHVSTIRVEAYDAVAFSGV